jgi:hypothetical protein
VEAEDVANAVLLPCLSWSRPRSLPLQAHHQIESILGEGAKQQFTADCISLLQAHYAPFGRRLSEIFGTNKVTNKMIQNKPRLLNQRVSGLKHEMARWHNCLILFLDKN